MLRSLTHENLLRFFAWYETQNHLWLILEYCVGGDLLSVLKQDARLPESSVCGFTRDLLAALQAVHGAGWVHCDLKPSNVLLDEGGHLRLCGFGLARRLAECTPVDSAASVDDDDAARHRRGTPTYMAPELFADGGVPSFASDLWALGCLVFECVAGRPPFVAGALSELMQAVVSDAPPPLPASCTPAFRALCAGLLNKDPLERTGWGELETHPFLPEPLALREMPEEASFEAYKAQRLASAAGGAAAGALVGGASGAATPPARSHSAAVIITDDAQAAPSGRLAAHRSPNGGVDVLRLSQIARTNLQKARPSALGSNDPPRSVLPHSACPFVIIRPCRSSLNVAPLSSASSITGR